MFCNRPVVAGGSNTRQVVIEATSSSFRGCSLWFCILFWSSSRISGIRPKESDHFVRLPCIEYSSRPPIPPTATFGFQPKLSPTDRSRRCKLWRSPGPCCINILSIVESLDKYISRVPFMSLSRFHNNQVTVEDSHDAVIDVFVHDCNSVFLFMPKY